MKVNRIMTVSKADNTAEIDEGWIGKNANIYSELDINQKAYLLKFLFKFPKLYAVDDLKTGNKNFSRTCYTHRKL